MKKFIIEIILFSSVLLVSFYWVLSRANGYSDAFYIRFTTPKQSSLILGDSRAAQGLKPKIFNDILNRNDFFNYSFSRGQSPFGKIYLESIKRKINHETKDGIFIISVEPWSICSKTEDPNDIRTFRENDLALKINSVNLNPNIFYLLKCYNKPYINLLYQKKRPVFVHNDGWLEVSIPMDFASKQNRLENKIKHYKVNHLPQYKFSL